MARQLWLADVLRAAGLPVVEVPGWKERGWTDYDPEGVIIHETRGSATSSDAGEINVMINGREGLAGPIAQLYLSRTGTWHVVTAGRSNHVRTGWGGPFKGLGNHRLLGIEAQHAGGEGWTATQYDSYVRGVAAIVRHKGWPPPVGHREHQPGDKPDPIFDMTKFRRDVAAQPIGDDMPDSDQLTTANWRLYGVAQMKESVDNHVNNKAEPLPLVTAIKRIDVATAKIAGLVATVQLLAEAVNAGGGNLDTVAVLARIDERAAEDAERDAAAAARIAQLEADLAAANDREAAAARAAADALDGPS